jgi:hypothetical protein
MPVPTIGLDIGDKRYQWVLGTYGYKALERSLGMSLNEVLAAASEKMTMGMTLALFHAGLALHHPDLTEREASKLLDEYGIGAFLEKMSSALVDQMPEGSQQANPPQAAASGNGTGTPPYVAG